MKIRALAFVLCSLIASSLFAQVVPPTQSISVQDSGTQCSVAGTCAVWPLANTSPSFTVQITGTFSATLTFRGSSDNVTFFDILATKVSTGVAATTTTTTGQYSFTNPGLLTLRVVGTTVASGGANLTLTRGSSSSARSSSGSGPSFGTLTAGDVLYASSSTAVSGLAVGSAGQIVRSTGTLPAYSTATYPNTFVAGDLAVATGTNVLGVVTDAAVGQLLASGGVGVVPAYTASPSITGTYTQTLTALAATSTDGIIAANGTNATMGATVQISPRIRMTANGWDSDDAVTRPVRFFSEVLPTSAATVVGTWKLGFMDPITNALTYPATVSSSGNLVTLGSVQSGNNVDFAGNLRGGAASTDIVYLKTTPTISSGFSTTTPSIAGTASAFAVTIAATPGTTGVVAFNGTFTNTPMCIGTNDTTSNSVFILPTTTGATITGVWVAGDHLRVICLGY